MGLGSTSPAQHPWRRSPVIRSCVSAARTGPKPAHIHQQRSIVLCLVQISVDVVAGLEHTGRSWPTLAQLVTRDGQAGHCKGFLPVSSSSRNSRACKLRRHPARGQHSRLHSTQPSFHHSKWREQEPVIAAEGLMEADRHRTHAAGFTAHKSRGR